MRKSDNKGLFSHAAGMAVVAMVQIALPKGTIAMLMQAPPLKDARGAILGAGTLDKLGGGTWQANLERQEKKFEIPAGKMEIQIERGDSAPRTVEVKKFFMDEWTGEVDEDERHPQPRPTGHDPQLNEAAVPMFKIARDPRVTRVGRFIRYAPADLEAYIAARRVRASRS